MYPFQLSICAESEFEEESTLEEIQPRADSFGYIAAVNLGGRYDVFHVVYEVTYERSLSTCFEFDCFKSPRQKYLNHAYIDAIIINFMRTKVVEQLKIEGLTTRGEHHRTEIRYGGNLKDFLKALHWISSSFSGYLGRSLLRRQSRSSALRTKKIDERPTTKGGRRLKDKYSM